MDTRTFPIQSDYRDTKAHPTTIPWEVADKAYAVYRGRYGSQQTLERLAERGGFSGGEMDEFYPGWRDEVSGIAVRDARIAALEAQVKALTEERDQACRERADAQHRYTVAMHDISKACAGTTARSACEVVELWRKERDAQVEVIGRNQQGAASIVELCKRITSGNAVHHARNISTIAGSIAARAAVEGGKQG